MKMIEGTLVGFVHAETGAKRPLTPIEVISENIKIMRHTLPFPSFRRYSLISIKLYHLFLNKYLSIQLWTKESTMYIVLKHRRIN